MEEPELEVEEIPEPEPVPEPIEEPVVIQVRHPDPSPPPPVVASPPPAAVPVPSKKSWASIVQSATPTDVVYMDTPKSRSQPPTPLQEQQPVAVSEDENFSLATNNNNNNVSKFNNHLAAGTDDMADDPFLFRLGGKIFDC